MKFKTGGCQAKFNELFQNDIIEIDETYFEDLTDCLLITEGPPEYRHSVRYIKELYPAFERLANEFTCRDFNSFSYQDQQKNIILYHNNF